MAHRVTEAELYQLIKVINSNLPEHLHVSLRFAYGSTGVSGNKDSSDLSGLGTKKETSIFLRGIQEGMDLAAKAAAHEALVSDPWDVSDPWGAETETENVTEADLLKLQEHARKALQEPRIEIPTQEPLDPEIVMQIAEFIHNLKWFCNDHDRGNYPCNGAEDHIEQAESMIRSGVMFPKE